MQKKTKIEDKSNTIHGCLGQTSTYDIGYYISNKYNEYYSEDGCDGCICLCLNLIGTDDTMRRYCFENIEELKTLAKNITDMVSEVEDCLGKNKELKISIEQDRLGNRLKYLDERIGELDSKKEDIIKEKEDIRRKILELDKERNS